jgi:hypothetical protein
VPDAPLDTPRGMLPAYGLDERVDALVGVPPHLLDATIDARQLPSGARERHTVRGMTLCNLATVPNTHLLGPEDRIERTVERQTQRCLARDARQGPDHPPIHLPVLAHDLRLRYRRLTNPSDAVLF